MKKKVNLYIDGFNLYFGLRSLRKRQYRWLDLVAVGSQLCRPDQELGAVKYFTARIKGGDKAKIKRQSVYLEALEVSGVQIVYGKYQQKMVTCPVCKKKYPRYEEKESDVNLGATLLVDAAGRKADYYLVVSGDSDLIRPMELARDVYEQDIIAVFPPNRHSSEIKRRIGKFIPMSESLVRKCQLPPSIKKKGGFVLQRPKKWK